MKKFIKKIIRWAFGNKLKLFQCRIFLSDYERAISKNVPSPEHYKREIIRKLSDEMYENDLIIFENFRDENQMGEVISAKVYCLKLKI